MHNSYGGSEKISSGGAYRQLSCLTLVIIVCGQVGESCGCCTSTALECSTGSVKLKLKKYLIDSTNILCGGFSWPGDLRGPFA